MGAYCAEVPVIADGVRTGGSEASLKLIHLSMMKVK